MNMEAITIGDPILTADERKVIKKILERRGALRDIMDMTGLHHTTIRNAMDGRTITKDTYLKLCKVISR